jgi:hypothetical protein
MPPLTFSPLTALMFGRVNLLDGYQKSVEEWWNLHEKQGHL